VKTVKLTAKVHIPDETFVPTAENPSPPTATNYPGAVLELSDELADELIALGKAVAHVVEPPAEAPEDGAQ
jgi:hypothetical protein